MIKKIIAISALSLFWASTVYAQEAENVEGKFEVKREIYHYKSSESRDPFLSIITAAKLEQEEQRKKTKRPLESFDIRQMKLVAVVKEQATKDYYALLGMPDGKFYSVSEGMQVGIHQGKVTTITLDRVVVREMLRNYKNELVPQDTIIRLRKGEE